MVVGHRRYDSTLQTDFGTVISVSEFHDEYLDEILGLDRAVE